MLNKLLELTYNWRLEHGIHTIDELQIGGHCGLCGVWISDEIMPKDWAIGLCDKHNKEDENEYN